MDDQDKSQRIGEELVKREVITKEDLDRARELELTSGIPWYRQLLQAGKLGYNALEEVLHYEWHPRSLRAKNESLGQILLNMKAINQAQLDESMVEQNRTGRLLGKILLEKKFIDQRTMTLALSKQEGLEYADLEKTPSDPSAIERVPKNLAIRHRILPVRLEGDRLVVLIGDSDDRNSLKDLGILLGLRIYPILTCTDDIRTVIDERYLVIEKNNGYATSQATQNPLRADSNITNDLTNLMSGSVISEDKKQLNHDGIQSSEGGTMSQNSEQKRFTDIARQASGVPVIKLVQTIIDGAVNSGATDIHLDPQEPEMRVRYRIDGLLHDIMSISSDIESAVISRIKLMADLDITETRHPQDGHISMQAGGRDFDIRVATLPTYLGERIVLRLLDQTSVLAGVKDIGLEKDQELSLLRLIQQPYGMILVTGPTGSGKTTTLYAALNQKNVLEESIVTIEDPVEYQLSGINQVQVDPDINVTFATTLRAALRQDIDVLLVGEIRDPETAHIAVRAAMTGHLVFSTLHTNDAPEAISALKNMGVPSYLIASALTAVIAQRLVRVICPECKKSFVPNKPLLQSVGLPATTKKLYRGTGCDVCYHSGNRGRTGVFELLEITPEVRSMIASESPIENIIKQAKMNTIADQCRIKMKRGEINPEEYLKIIRA